MVMAIIHASSTNRAKLVEKLLNDRLEVSTKTFIIPYLRSIYFVMERHTNKQYKKKTCFNKCFT